MVDEYDLEHKKEYEEFIKEYGWRDEWDYDNPEFTPQWDDWRDLFNSIKSQWKLDIGEKKYLSNLYIIYQM